jgi:catechol 2,3-dioxygenase-like lactoylglutathione lyase family enzyme
MEIFNALIPELSVVNTAKSLHFYLEILGFKLEYQRPEEGFAFISLGGAQLMLDQIGEGRTWQTEALSYPLGRGVNFQIEVTNLDTLLDNLKKNQISLFLEPEEKWYRKGDQELGTRQFLVQDPDGYLLRFAEDLGIRPHTNN